MRSGLKLGTVFGIQIFLSYSWFILLFLIGWSITGGILPQVFPELTATETLVIGLTATVFLFLSVVSHELAHSVYAKRSGLKIDRITLFIFGGAAELKEEPKTPKQEFIMAAVGPLTSIGLSIIFGIVYILGIANSNLPLVAFGSVLSSLNLTLAIFNLVPGFPLDGGRILRSIIWKITGNLLKATKIASNGGKVVSFAIVGLGMLQILSGNLSGLWLMLIGYFLYLSARSSFDLAVARVLLRDVQVKELMSRPPVITEGGRPLKNFVEEHMFGPGETAAVVRVSGEEEPGIITKADIEHAPSHARVGDVAQRNNQFIEPGDAALDAMQIMLESGQNIIPVMKNNKIVGLLTLDNLRSYITGRQILSQLQ